MAPERPELTPASNGKLAVSVTEAADLLGTSADHFRRHVLPELRIVRSGRLRLVPISELEAWIERHAARALTRERSLEPGPGQAWTNERRHSRHAGQRAPAARDWRTTGARGVAREREGEAMTENGKQICEAKTRAADAHPCRMAAGAKTDHYGFGRCWLHGGASPDGRKYAAKQQAVAEASRLGIAIDTDPHEALSEIVAIIAGQVSFLQGKVRELDQGEALTKDALHPTIRALNSVLEQWQRAAKAAADAGVEQRRVELDEAVVERLAGAVRAALSEVALSDEQQAQLREALTRHLAGLDDLDWRRPRELAA